MLRISGETSTDGLTVTGEWKALRYTFEVRGSEEVLLVCEFRSPGGGLGEFDAGSLRLVRKAPAKKAGEGGGVQGLAN
jgi:hypothetical protein